MLKEDYLHHRSEQFRQQVARRIDGSLTEEEFRPLRLMNGVYLQLHAYMLRVAIPYGTLNPDQMRKLAEIADRWDRGYGHLTTRQNIQFNWPRLTDIPDMLDALAEVGMHAIQTSGNTVRNVTTDVFAGAAEDEADDPRPWAELLRFWSTDHPEFQFLPRKFKIAISGGESDRAIIPAHDIGLRLKRVNDELGFEVWIGGGLGRTPMLGSVIRDFLPAGDLLPYVESILSAYNLSGRRDNKYKARIKITVADRGMDVIRKEVEEEFRYRRGEFTQGGAGHPADFFEMFRSPLFKEMSTEPFLARVRDDEVFASWARTNLRRHKADGYRSVIITMKAPDATPGDITSAQMRFLANLAERFGHDDIRVSHDQNIVLPHVHEADVPMLYDELMTMGMATGNAGLMSDIIACPGLDYCALATARSIPIAKDIASHFRAEGLEREIGGMNLRISGCINACGHHHLGHIGILGLDRAGVENYQITLGGDAYDAPAIGTRAGAGFPASDVVPAIDRLMRRYVSLRSGPDERFIDAYRRIGPKPFKEALYEVKEHA